MDNVLIEPQRVQGGHAETGAHATEKVSHYASRIERRVQGELRRYLETHDLDIDPDTVRVTWRCEVEVMGYRMPEGWPESERDRWLEVVKMAEENRLNGVSPLVVSIPEGQD